jgi:hypothetical protein
MPSTESQRSYLRRAFLDQHNLIALGGSLTFSAALASWVPLAAASLLELGWLSVAPRAARFRRAADRFDARLLGETSRRVAESESDSLDGQDRARHAALSDHLDTVISLYSTRPSVSFDEVRGLHSELERLRIVYVSLLRAQRAVTSSAPQISGAELKAQVADLERTWSTSRDIEVRMGRRRVLLAARGQLEEYERLSGQREDLELGLAAIEDGVLTAKSRVLGEFGTQPVGAVLRALLSDLAAPASSVAAASDLAAEVLARTADARSHG